MEGKKTEMGSSYVHGSYIHGSEVNRPSRTHVTVEMALRIASILFGSIALVVSTSLFFGAEVVFFGDVSFPFGSVGYALAIAILGIILQVPIVILRTLAYSRNHMKFFYPVTIALSFFLALAHTVAGIVCSILAATSTVRGDVSMLPLPLVQLFGSVISNAVISFFGMVLYGTLGAWELSVKSRLH